MKALAAMLEEGERVTMEPTIIWTESTRTTKLRVQTYRCRKHCIEWILDCLKKTGMMRLTMGPDAPPPTAQLREAFVIVQTGLNYTRGTSIRS